MVGEVDTDNRDLVDSNDSQRLTYEEIEAMKAQGSTGKEIIEALKQNSDTWDSKTAFAKQKWLQKKEKRHAPRVRLVKCTAATLGQHYFAHKPDRIMGLRPDSLAQLLAYANVFAGGQV